MATVEWSDEQVKAAARAWHETRTAEYEGSSVPWDDVPEDQRGIALGCMRAALTAAVEEDEREPVTHHTDAEASNAIAAFVTERMHPYMPLGYTPFSARYGVAGDVLKWLDEHRRTQPAPRTVTAEEAAEDAVAALLLALHDAHPSYGSTSGWRGGIGGSAITQGCSIIDPPPGAEWTQYDLLSEPARRYIVAHPTFDLAAAKERVKSAALAALGITVTD